jgi:hypothetical protein
MAGIEEFGFLGWSSSLLGMAFAPRGSYNVLLLFYISQYILLLQPLNSFDLLHSFCEPCPLNGSPRILANV